VPVFGLDGDGSAAKITARICNTSIEQSLCHNEDIHRRD